MASSTEGSPTSTGWKRRSSAASFSMCLRYSSSVVAPTARSSPRASIGLRRVAAATPPSAAPGPPDGAGPALAPVASGADDRVQLVHEQDDRAAGLLDLVEDRLQALLELAAVLRAGEQRADVERDHAAVTQRLGDVAGDDALGEALDDGGLADAGLADQDGVVLRAAAEDLDDAADLVVAPDDRVELALLGLLGEVAAELFERPVLVLGALVGHAVRAAHLRDGLQQRVLRRAVRAQRGPGPRAMLREREQDVLGRHVLVFELAHLAFGVAQDPDELARRAGGLATGADRRQGLEGRGRLSPDRREVGAELAEHGDDD